MIELPVVDADEAAKEEAKASGTRFWRSFNHLKGEEGFKETMGEEFMPGESQPPSGPSRRKFLQLMGASMALAGLSACRRPVEPILPYTRKPEEIIPGIPRYFATAMPFRGSVRPLLVESHEERPTKVEGNTAHPFSNGGSGVFAQASVLNLYDPDRSQEVIREGGRATWQDFVGFVRELISQADAANVAVLAEPTSSPTVVALRQQLAEQFSNFTWVTYAPEGDNSAELGMQEAFGQRLRPLYRFAEAETIVSLDADFLKPTDESYLYNTRQYAESRMLSSPEEDLNRLYVVDSTHSLTGGMADNRVRMRASAVPAFAAALAAELGLGESPAAASLSEKQRAYVQEAAQDLREAGERGLVLAGETQPPQVHALCAAINGTLNSIGTTMLLLDISEGQEAIQEGSSMQQLADLTQQMQAGQVDALFMIGTDPVYNAPSELNFEAALKQVPQTIHLGTYLSETGQAARWHVPRAHYLEAWGDGRAYNGTLSVIQPLIAPLYEAAHSEVEVLNLLATGVDRAGYDIVREVWRGRLEGDFESTWREVLHDGFLPDSQYPQADVSVGAVPAEALQAEAPGEELEVVFRLDPTVLAGEYANNAWCQELPDPVTKITWDNVAIVSPATAEELELQAGYDRGQYYVDVIELTVNGETVALPVWILPGHPNGSISVTLGYGRDIASDREERDTWFFDTGDETDVFAHGPLGNGVGTNVAPLRSVQSMRVATGAQVRKTGETYMIATTQDHGVLDLEARPLFRIADMETYRENPDFVVDMGEPSPGEPWDEYPELYEDHPSDQPAFKDSDYYQYQWGMTIDLNTCTGCNACVIACQSENNIPVVGKEEVSRGREMHWLRVDRYYVSTEEDADNPEMVLGPIPCMHCENAPCEPVCPVAATMHTPDGTSQMIYNRCIGTRYCSNNCPYKVRRFNFFDWTPALPETVQMVLNPNVTVRSRGVMEKCSYCVQRIRNANRRSDIEERPIRDGEVQTACQQACPADAITFGDVSDPTTEVSREKSNSRRYEMLAELNVKPRTSYLGRVRNPNHRLEDEIDTEALIK